MRRLRVIAVLIAISIVGTVSAGRAQQPQYGGVLKMIQVVGLRFWATTRKWALRMPTRTILARKG